MVCLMIVTPELPLTATTYSAGWTPLHHAALLSPPTLISHLMTHGCSPFAVTRRNLTPLDIVTGHTIMPGREDVALLLEEAMRGDGWEGGRMARKRKVLDERLKKQGRRKHVRDEVAKTLSVDNKWWGDDDSDTSSDDSDMDDELEHDEDIYVSARLFDQGLSLRRHADTPARLFVYASILPGCSTTNIRLPNSQFSAITTQCSASQYTVSIDEICVLDVRSRLA